MEGHQGGKYIGGQGGYKNLQKMSDFVFFSFSDWGQGGRPPMEGKSKYLPCTTPLVPPLIADRIK